MTRSLLFSFALLVGAAAPGQAQVTLEHKLTAGASYSVETNEQIEQKLSIAGTDIDTGGNTTVITKVTVGKRDDQGNTRVATKVESLKISMNVLGANYNFDSENPDAKGDSQLEPFRPVHKAICKRESTVVYDKDGKVSAVEADQSAINALPVELQNQVKSELDPTALKEAANDEIDQLKREPINKGDTWQRTANAQLGAGQVMTFKTEYTYDGTIDKDGKTLDKVTSKILEVSYALQNSPLPFSVKSSELKPVESDGTILFDRKEGRVVEATSSVRITGDMTFTINDQNLPAKLDLKLQKATLVKP